MKGVYVRTEWHNERIREGVKKSTRKPYVRTEEYKEKMREACKGIHKGKGHPHTEEHKKYMSDLMRGEKNHQWKGGVKPIHRRIRHSLEYRTWRNSVFSRDNFTCVECNVRGGELQADHIKSFSEHPDLRFDVNNGRTLCYECHRKTETWGAH